MSKPWEKYCYGTNKQPYYGCCESNRDEEGKPLIPSYDKRRSNFNFFFHAAVLNYNRNRTRCVRQGTEDI